MTWLIARLTFRELVAQRRILLMVALAAIPIAVAFIFRLGGEEADRLEFTVKALLAGLVLAGSLPVIAVVIGTAALGSEIEDMTLVYLLSKPISRAAVIAGKLAAAAGLVVALVVLPACGAAALALDSPNEGRIVAGFALALAGASTAYVAVFLALSLITSRALIVGLGYVFIWEGVIRSLFSGTRFLSIRHFAMGVAGAAIEAPGARLQVELSGLEGSVGMVVAVALGFGVAVRRLSRWEIREAP